MSDDDEKKMPIVKCEQKQIISIDFGSFGSQAAFCLPHSPSKFVVLKNWEGMEKCDTAMAKKTLTALLWDTKKKTVKSFGYKARELYSEYIGLRNDIERLQQELNINIAKLDEDGKLTEKEKNKIDKHIKRGEKSMNKKKTQFNKQFPDDELVYFEHFKPHLMGKDALMKDKEIYSTDGSTKLSILKLIELSLIEIKKQALKEADAVRKDRKLDVIETKLKEDEILWALSTPSVWDDTSRGAFRECVENAGMKNHVIGLEPEFALFCMAKTDSADFLEVDKKYLILDCGAGTTDATCIETNDGSELAEIIPRSGRPLGSLMIDEIYYKMLSNIFGESFIEMFKRDHPHKWNMLKTSFWKAKHIVDPETFKGTGCNVEFPQAFWKCFEKKFDADDEVKEDEFDDYVNRLCSVHSETFGNADYIKYDEESQALTIDVAIWHMFHEQLLDDICKFVKELLSDYDMDDCDHVILVGGFGQSPFLRNRLIEQFTDGVDEYDSRKIKFDLAPRPSWSVVIGGLFWAYNLDHYKRRMWLTYGFEVDAEWKIGDCKKNKYPSMNSSTGYIKKHVFDPVIFKNDPFDEHEQVKRKYVIPFSAGQLELKLYCVDCENGANFTTDKDDDGNDICTVAATYILRLKDKNWVSSKQQALPVTIEFEDTMIKLIITRPDRKQEEMKIKNPKLKK